MPGWIDNVYGETQLPCVTCNGKNVHPVSVKVHKGKKAIHVYSGGIGVINEVDVRIRGVIVSIEFLCEFGCKNFLINYAFHKGSTFLSSFALSRRTEKATIWRD